MYFLLLTGPLTHTFSVFQISSYFSFQYYYRSIIERILKETNKSGLSDEVLSTLHQLLLLPTDVSLGGMAWNHVGRCVGSVVKASTSWSTSSSWVSFLDDDLFF